MSDKPTKKGLPQVQGPRPPVVKPPLPSQAQRNALRDTLHLYPVGNGAHALVANHLVDFKAMLSNARCVGMQIDLDRFAMATVSCEERNEEATRVAYKLIRTSDGAKYRMYDQRCDMMSSEKYGIPFTTLEHGTKRYFLYKNDDRRPWPE